MTRILRSKWLRAFMPDHLVVRVTAFFLFCILVITLLTYYFEHAVDEHFSTPLESFWSITIYLFSGLEDRNPYTGAGKVIAAIGLILGPAYFAFMTGWLAKFLISWEKSMPQNLKDHYLILNWTDRGKQLVEELHHPVIIEKEGTAVIVVLTDDENLTVKRLKDSGSGSDKVFEDFFVSIGDPTSERALLNANAQDTRCVLVLADETLKEMADERTIRSVVMLRRIARQTGKRLHVVAELVNAANTAVLDEIAQDFPGTLERISGLKIRTCLMAQAALSKGVVDFYSDLLRVSDDTNEVYIRPVPDSAVGLRFREYAARILERELTNPVIPVGIQRQVDGRVTVLCNPRAMDGDDRLRDTDRLILIAYEPPDPEDVEVEGRAGKGA